MDHHVDLIVNNYEKLYDTMKDPNYTFRSHFPASYEETLTPTLREAILKWRKIELQLREAVETLYDEKLNPGTRRLDAIRERSVGPLQSPIKVCVTGASGHLGYALLFRIASGALFGPRTPVRLSLLELPTMMNSLAGVVMELKDSAFPLLHDVTATDKPHDAFHEVDYAILVGARPRSKGMERGDLLKANAEIFSVQGKALNEAAKGDKTRVLVVGNPANTNALICSHNAPAIPPENFSAMMRLDHNRGLAQLSNKFSCDVEEIERFVVWGNHSATQFPDISHARIKGQWATDLLQDKAWLKNYFYPTVQKRGAAIIEQRGLSSAASAASAAAETVADWYSGTHGRWTSSAVISNGEYGVTPGLFYSYPVVYKAGGEWDIVRDLPITEESAGYMELTHKELLAERDEVAELLQ
eukprot:TRINITY_DN359_c0_g1_i2.p1 TRINITY_DN359_c0_g1~~TRINITY_DN359_c0_g1_i2.p1  ORF type:complete len:414 (-),score=90.41 TRINITY_DN359_c0_g1_i2:47-1288(-)